MNRQQAPTDANKDEDSPIKSTRGAARKPFKAKEAEPVKPMHRNTISHKGPIKPVRTNDQRKAAAEEQKQKATADKKDVKEKPKPAAGRKSNLSRPSAEGLDPQQPPLKRTATLVTPSANKFKRNAQKAAPDSSLSKDKKDDKPDDDSADKSLAERMFGGGGDLPEMLVEELSSEEDKQDGYTFEVENVEEVDDKKVSDMELVKANSTTENSSEQL